jgi:hypothetical protein
MTMNIFLTTIFEVCFNYFFSLLKTISSHCPFKSWPSVWARMRIGGEWERGGGAWQRTRQEQKKSGVHPSTLISLKGQSHENLIKFFWYHSKAWKILHLFLFYPFLNKYHRFPIELSIHSGTKTKHIKFSWDYPVNI